MCLLMYEKDIIVMNVSTESMVNFCPMHVYLFFKKSSYIGLVKFSSAERKKSNTFINKTVNRTAKETNVKTPAYFQMDTTRQWTMVNIRNYGI